MSIIKAFCSPVLLGFLIGTALIYIFLPLLLVQLAIAIGKDGITLHR